MGLAQARYPLDTTNHYFEIEIVDPGENCYIAIGLAKRVSTQTILKLVLVICINIFAFAPNLHISQMTSLACRMMDDVINMHNLRK